MIIALILITTTVVGGIIAGVKSVKETKDAGEEVNAWEVVKDVVLGASLGLALGGAAIATGGVLYGAVAGVGASYLGVTALQGFAIGALAFNFTAMIIAPLFGFEMEPIEYEQPSYNTNQPIF